jgi:Rrf2 family transcriptional regulator, nitric oxide-sensitive transcriptional repressor
MGTTGTCFRRKRKNHGAGPRASGLALVFGPQMQLRMYTDYALRALLYVGSHPGQPVPASTIAAAYGISLDHLAKATKALTRAGFLSSTRGVGGGVELAKPASEIRVGAVVRLFEEPTGLVDCKGERSEPCRIASVCRLRTALAAAEDAFFAELDAVTLEDLLGGRSQLVRLLGPSGRRT